MTLVKYGSKKCQSELESDPPAPPEPSKEHLEEVVPEGGWGWLIVVAIAMSKVATFGILPLLAIVFKSVITSNPGSEGSAVTFLVGLFFLFAELTGILFPTLNHRLSLRTTSVAGGIILTLGGVGSIFAVSLPQLAVTYCVLQGAGYGLMVSSTVNAFNQHFCQRRMTAMATAQFATSVLSVGLPHGVQAALDAGGERAGRTVVMALGIATAASQLFVRGVPRPAPEPAQDAQHPLKKNEEADTEGENTPHRSTPNMKESSKRRIRGLVRRCAMAVWHHLGFSHRPLRAATVWGPALGLSLVHVGDTNFFALLPLHLSKVGLLKEQVTRAIAAANIGDAVGRLTLVILGIWLGRRNRHVFAVCSIGTAICVLGISWQVSWEAVLTFSSLLGMFRGMLYVTLFLGIAEVVPPTLFPSALALFFFFVFVSSLIMAPLIGLVRDGTRSYPASFIFVAALCALYPVAWTAHALLRRCLRRKRLVIASGAHRDRQRLDLYQQIAEAKV